MNSFSIDSQPSHHILCKLVAPKRIQRKNTDRSISVSVVVHSEGVAAIDSTVSETIEGGSAICQLACQRKLEILPLNKPPLLHSVLLRFESTARNNGIIPGMSKCLPISNFNGSSSLAAHNGPKEFKKLGAAYLSPHLK